MSSRLFVRNIPKHITEERLKQHFSQKGTVTDVKILKRKYYIICYYDSIVVLVVKLVLLDSKMKKMRKTL